MATNKVRLFRPAQVITFAFILLVVIGTILLSLPISRADGKYGFSVTSAFTAISALCVTGLTTADTQTFWTPVGHLVILALIKVGGFGIMAFTALLSLLVAHRMSLRSAMVSSEEHRAISGGDVRKVLIRIALVGAIIEATGTIILTIRFFLDYGFKLNDAFWYAIFHSVSAFNNAGFGLFSDNLTRFNADPVILIVLSSEVILGSIGFPVLLEIVRHVYKRIKDRRSAKRFPTLLHWSLTTRIVLIGTGILLSAGMVYFGFIEWNNQETIGQMDPWRKLLNIFVLSVMPRTAGFNAIDIGSLTNESLIGMDLLMFIGGASGGTAGGLKITTIAVLIFIVIAEIRGENAVNIGKRRLPRSVHRQALALLLLYGALLIGSVLALSLLTGFSTDQLLFEAASALGTVGLTTGITAQLPVPAQLVVMLLMFVGRVGPTLVASSLAVRIGKGFIQYPKERPTIG